MNQALPPTPDSSRWKRFVRILKEMQDVLTEHGHYGQAEVTRRLIRLAAEDDVAFLKLLQSPDVWGGAGALWEISELGADKSRYWALVIALAGVMAREDVETERSRSIAETLSGWLAG